MRITPLIHQALHACAAAPDNCLRRVRDGYAAAGTNQPVFTKRLIQSMHRDWLVELHGDMANIATLTSKGRKALADDEKSDKAVAA